MLHLCSDRLKNERKKLKLTQQKLALLLDVSDMTIKRWETGVTAIPSDKLILMKNLGFDISYVLFGEIEQTYSHEEELLIIKYRQAATEVKDKILATLFRLERETSGDVVNQGANSGKGTQNNAKIQTINNAPSTTNQTKIKIGKQRGDVVNGDKNVTR
ncbi:helix-turn-helix domain-containing protein [Acinetobacter sp. 243_ASPC]|uniref:helix-turn-helix domain-containing protein n=1 Tax=Acinetobacter sp. 243_ASPC TaxID=1579345 RepID=UPI000660024D|nr:helix-turn-helix domain-containing protein [Acinetobacter sp. 243_ASPC]